jgi:hypothetical protein
LFEYEQTEQEDFDATQLDKLEATVWTEQDMMMSTSLLELK